MSGTGQMPPFRFVAIVGSLGALPVLSMVLEQLPETFPVPVLVVQHRSAGTNGDILTGLLQRYTALPVRLGGTGRPAWSPGITVIPGCASATVTHDHRLLLHPATVSDLGGDELLATAAMAAQPEPGIGVILSGTRQDGAAGVRSVKREGGRVLAQDPATARAPGMPTAALATGCVDFVLPPQRIAPALIALAMAPGGADLLTVPTPHWAGLGAG